MESGGSGTHTFLFTDIEGSTRRWQADPDAMAEALATHDEVLARVIDDHGGHLFKHTGDGVCAAFGSAAAALDAAATAQRSLGLPVRMGIHSGEAEERDGDYFGPTLNRCARLMDAGHGGQILVSETTRALLDGTGLVDLGEHLLKDMARRERIYQLGDRGFPSLRVRSRAVKLPTSLTALVGREDLVAEVLTCLDQWRLVTLVGVGGVGKTRVAIAAAERFAPSTDLTVFVDLGSASDGTDVLPALARALEVKVPTTDAVSIALTGRRCLIVFDNCEHVLDDTADLVAGILASGPDASVIATSREGLAVDGEHLIAVPGLDTGPVESPAVALFIERAGAADHRFELGAENEPAVFEICRRLDGIPLAIELAAARIALMTPQELLQRLDERFRVLTGGRRRSVDRHRTLREAVDWSYQLLEPREQEMFAALSVFASSFDVAGAAAVSSSADEFEVIELLGALVDKSLLTTVQVEGHSRFRYLETIRSFAEEKLAEAGSGEAAEARLNRHLASVVRSLVDEMYVSAEDVASRLRDEIPNMRRALDWALANEDVDSAAPLVRPLLEVSACIDWQIDGWAGEILALDGAADHPDRAVLLALRAVDTWLGGDFRPLRAMADEFMAAAEQTAGPHVPWGILLNYGMLSGLGGGAAESARANQRLADAVAETSPEVRAYLAVRLLFGEMGSPVGPAADRWRVDAKEAASSSRSRLTRHLAAINRCVLAIEAGEADSMLDSAQEATALGVEGAGSWFASLQLQAHAHYENGDFAQAVAVADIDMEAAHRHGDRSAMVVPTLVYALCLMRHDEWEAAATVRGGLPRRMTIFMLDHFDELDRRLAEQLAPERLEELIASGREMSPRELQALTHAALADRLGSP